MLVKKVFRSNLLINNQFLRFGLFTIDSEKILKGKKLTHTWKNQTTTYQCDQRDTIIDSVTTAKSPSV